MSDYKPDLDRAAKFAEGVANGVDRLLLREYCTPSYIQTVLSGWPARDALPTTDPEDC